MIQIPETKYDLNVFWYKFSKIVLYALIFALIFEFLWGNLLNSILFFTIFVVIPRSITAAFQYDSTSFSVDQGVLSKKSGVMFKKVTILNLEKIQNVVLKGGAMLGLFDLVSLEVWTAAQTQMVQGNAHPDLTLMLPSHQAEEFKNVLTGGIKTK